jgi:hypothetical protein
VEKVEEVEKWKSVKKGEREENVLLATAWRYP